MLRVIKFLTFAIVLVTTQESAANEACCSHTNNFNYNYCKDTSTTRRTFRNGTITTDCNDNIETTGVYYLKTNQPVYCELAFGGNWLIFQRRVDSSVDFYRNWIDYRRGFGDAEGNFWLGLDALHAITSSGSYELRVDLEDWNENTSYALYSSFSVGNEASNYRLTVSGYSGNAGDGMGIQNEQQFSTKNRDNDNFSGHCAVRYHGAWWYNSCYRSNLNGEYLENQINDLSINWYPWNNNFQSLKRSVMKIRPN